MRILILSILLAAASAASLAQGGPPDTKALIAAQQKAMLPLKPMDGTWRGWADVTLPDGRRVKHTHTERAGGFLSDSVKVIEGRSYQEDGSVGFNAFAIISFSPMTGKYSMQSYAQGFSGNFPIEIRADGYSWTVPAGPGATIKYEATLKDGTWTEVGDRVVEGQPPRRIFEMQLRRVGDSDWPAANPVPMK